MKRKSLLSDYISKYNFRKYNLNENMQTCLLNKTYVSFYIM